MGPVWDFDIAFGGYHSDAVNSPQRWHTTNVYWNKYLLQDSIMEYMIREFWFAKEKYFLHTVDIIDSIQNVLQSASTNNFKKWNILSSKKNWYHPKEYQNYKDATDDLKKWISQRIKWIDSQLKQLSQ